MIPSINLEYACKHFLGKLRNALGPITYPEEDTWINKDYFLELAYWRALLYYNGGRDKSYPNPILKLV